MNSNRLKIAPRKKLSFKAVQSKETAKQQAEPRHYIYEIASQILEPGVGYSQDQIIQRLQEELNISTSTAEKGLKLMRQKKVIYIDNPTGLYQYFLEETK